MDKRLIVTTECAKITHFSLPPARKLIISWNTRSPAGSLELICRLSDERISSRLRYVTFSQEERRSWNGSDAVAEIMTDVLHSSVPITALEVHADIPLDALAVSIPFPTTTPSRPLTRSLMLEVPERSQHHPNHPEGRTWCSPAATAMLLAYWGIDLSVPETALCVYDMGYGGTGNWTFNTALAGTLGLRGITAYLRNLAHAAAFVRAGIPLALSFSWEKDELPGAPLEHSAGHLAVLRGFDEDGNPIFNDPAQPQVTTTYPYEAFERAWLAHDGVAYLIASPERTDELLRLANDPP